MREAAGRAEATADFRAERNLEHSVDSRSHKICKYMEKGEERMRIDKAWVLELK